MACDHEQQNLEQTANHKPHCSPRARPEKSRGQLLHIPNEAITRQQMGLLEQLWRRKRRANIEQWEANPDLRRTVPLTVSHCRPWRVPKNLQYRGLTVFPSSLGAPAWPVMSIRARLDLVDR
jgi:hypothetical protein